MKKMGESLDYNQKKAFYSKILTIYGRNPVYEALSDPKLEIHRLHLAKSNKTSSIIERIEKAAIQRGVEIVMHDRTSLSRISKNGRQDQGVALDIVMNNWSSPAEFISKNDEYRVMALDGVTNPQNVGMIVRSCAAGKIDAVILHGKSAAFFSPLTVKASAGTIFKIPVIRSDSLFDALCSFIRHDAVVFTLDATSGREYRSLEYPQRCVFVLGNESEGVSAATRELSTESLYIPMRRGVESLNVAAAATLLAFMDR